MTEAQDEVQSPKTPYEMLALFSGAPSESQIQTLRQTVPGGMLRLLPMKNGERVFLLRGFTMLEKQAIHAEVMKVPEEKRVDALHMKTAIHCTVWTSVTKTGRLIETDLLNAGAGLSATLYHSIVDLSDFVEPAYLEQLFIDL